MESQLGGNAEPTFLIKGNNITTPEGLAYDYLANNLYFTDSSHKVKEISNRKSMTNIASTAFK